MEHSSAMEEPSLKILRRFLLAVAIILMSFGVVNVTLTQQNINRGIVETTIIQHAAGRLEGTQVSFYVFIVDFLQVERNAMETSVWHGDFA